MTRILDAIPGINAPMIRVPKAICRNTEGQHYCSSTLCDVARGTDRNVDVVESGGVRGREIRIRTLTLLDHVALITCLLTRLSNKRS